jgi:hypothetical protein
MQVLVDRNTQQSTLVGTIAGDGSTLCPMEIVERVTIEADFRLYGYSVERIDICPNPTMR